MNPQLLPISPRLLNNRYAGNIIDLLPHIQLAEDVLILLIRMNKVLFISPSKISDVREPGLKRSVVVYFEGCLDTSAAIVPGNNDVFDF
jgi:hypothetical protein